MTEQDFIKLCKNKECNSQFLFSAFQELEHKTQKVIGAMLSVDAFCIFNMDEQLQTEQNLCFAIEQNFNVVTRIKKLTLNLCKHAVSTNPISIKIIPPEFYVDEVFEAAISSDLNGIQINAEEFICNTIPEISDSLKKFMIEYDPTNLRLLKNPSNELIEFALKMSGICLRYVQNKKENHELTAVASSALAIQYFREDTPYSTYEKAVAINGSALYFIKEKTPQICLTAIRQYWFAIGAVPINMLTQEMCLAAYEQSKLTLLYLWPELGIFDEEHARNTFSNYKLPSQELYAYCVHARNTKIDVIDYLEALQTQRDLECAILDEKSKLTSTQSPARRKLDVM